MKKKVMKIGTSKGIIFTKNECDIYNLELGDIVDLRDIFITKKKWVKKNAKL